MDAKQLYNLSRDFVYSSDFFRRFYKLDKSEWDLKFGLAKEYFKDSPVPRDELEKILASALVILDKDELKRLASLFKKIAENYEPQQVFTEIYNYVFWNFLFTVIARLKNDFDYLLVIDGYEGTGKSRLALDISYFYRWIVFGRVLDEVNVTLSPHQVAKSMYHFSSKDTHYETIVFDEGGSVLFSREAMSKQMRSFVKIFKVARMMNWFLIVVAQNITWIDPYIRKHRLTGWIHVKNRGLGYYVSGNEFKKHSEFSQSHFDVEKFLTRVRKFVIKFTDFDFDEKVLTFYDDLKKGYVKETIAELLKLYEDVVVDNDDKDPVMSIWESSYYKFGIPFLARMPQLITVSPGNDTNLATTVKSLFPREYWSSARSYINVREYDPITSLLLMYDASQTEKVALLKKYNLPNELLAYFKASEWNQERGNYSGWFLLFDTWRALLSGIAKQVADHKTLLSNEPPQFSIFHYLRILRTLIGSNNIFEAYLIAHYPFDIKTKYEVSSKMLNYGFKKARMTFKELKTILFKRLSVQDIFQWFLYLIYQMELVVIPSTLHIFKRKGDRLFETNKERSTLVGIKNFYSLPFVDSTTLKRSYEFMKNISENRLFNAKVSYNYTPKTFLTQVFLSQVADKSKVIGDQIENILASFDAESSEDVEDLVARLVDLFAFKKLSYGLLQAMISTLKERQDIDDAIKELDSYKSVGELYNSLVSKEFTAMEKELLSFAIENLDGYIRTIDERVKERVQEVVPESMVEDILEEVEEKSENKVDDVAKELKSLITDLEKVRDLVHEGDNDESAE